MSPKYSAPGSQGGEGNRTPQGSVLYAVLICGKFRCALDANLVEGFDAAGDDEQEAAIPLARRLGLPSLLPAGRKAEHVHLAGGGLPLLVDQVEGIINPGEAGVLELPALTRLQRPVFSGVLCLSDSGIVPVLDLDELLSIDAQERA